MATINKNITNLSPEQLQQFFANTPSLPAPNGTISNFIDPPSRALMQISVTSPLFGIMLLFALNRLYVKLYLVRKVTWDDSTLLLGTISAIAYYAASVRGAKYGRFGIHEWDSSFLQLSRMDCLIPSYIVTVLGPFTFFFLKMTFFLLYLQIFDRLKCIKAASWVGLAATAISYSILSIWVFNYATPRPGESWLGRVTSSQEQTQKIVVPQAIIGLIIDLYILILPMIGVQRLQMSAKKKNGVRLIFLSGLMACVCSACSIYYRDRLIHTTYGLWEISPVIITTSYEMFIGIICACMPSAALAVRHERSVFYRFTKSVSSSSNNSNSHLAFKYTAQTVTHPKSHVHIMTNNDSDPEALLAKDRKNRQYYNLEVLRGDEQWMDGRNGINTVVEGGGDGKMENHRGIRMQREFDVDVQQMV